MRLSNLVQKVKTELKMKCMAVNSTTRNTKVRTTMVTMDALIPKPVLRLVSRKMRRMAETEEGKMRGEAKRTEM